MGTNQDDNQDALAAGTLAELAELSEPTACNTDELYRQDPFVQGTGTKRGGFVASVRPVMSGEERRAQANLHRHKTTLDYPSQGKLLDALEPGAELRAGEPAEPLYMVIVVGDDELGSNALRSHLTTARAISHEAMVYRWRGSFTLDVIGFDAINEEAGRHSGRVDLVLLSDQICGSALEGEAIHGLEKAALEARFKFPDSYLVGVCHDEGLAWLDGHPWNSVEAKAGARDVAVFDHRLVGDVTAETVVELLVTFARSDKYASNRAVWTVPSNGSLPQPAPKGFLNES